MLHINALKIYFNGKIIPIMPRKITSRIRAGKPKYTIAALYQRLSHEQAVELKAQFAAKFPSSAPIFSRYIRADRTFYSADMLMFFSKFFAIHPYDLYARPIYPDMGDPLSVDFKPKAKAE